MFVRESSCVVIQGHVSGGFEAVREAFVENFAGNLGRGRRITPSPLDSTKAN